MRAAELIPPCPLSRVASGDSEGVRACLDRYGGLVWSLTRRFLKDRAEAEDAVQEIFIELWKHASRFDPSAGSDTTFVAMIARRRLIDRVRKRTRAPERVPLIEDADSGPEAGRLSGASGLDSDELAQAQEALASLSDEQQRVLRLSLANGLSHEQIASATGLPLGTVKTHLRRGMIRLRERLDRDRAGAAVGGQPSSDSRGGTSGGTAAMDDRERVS